MYKVLLDGAVFVNSADHTSNDVIINPKITLEENCAGSFSFTVPSRHSKYGNITRRKSRIAVYRNNEPKPLFVGYVVDTKKDLYKQLHVECEGELAFLNNSIQRPARYQGMTNADLFRALITAHNAASADKAKFQAGNITVPSGNVVCYSDYESTLKCMMDDLIENYGGYLSVRYPDNSTATKYLDWLADSTETCTQVIEVGSNVMDMSIDYSAEDRCSAVIPLGAKLDTSSVQGLDERLTIKSVNDGKDYLVNETVAADIGYIYKVVTFDDVTVASNLKAKGQEYLNTYQYENLCINVTAIDLRMTSSEFESFKLGQKVVVNCPAYGITSLPMRITKQTLNLNNPENDKLTLGTEKRSKISVKSAEASDEAKKAIANTPNTANVLTQALAQAKSLMEDGSNGYVTFVRDDDDHITEILIMDHPTQETAQNIWRWNSSGLAHSSDGGQTYNVALIGADGSIAATSGTVGAWKLSSNALYTDYTADDGTIYRTYIQVPVSADSWVYSVQKSTDGGRNFSGSYYVTATGTLHVSEVLSAVTFDGAVSGKNYINSDEYLSVRNADRELMFSANKNGNAYVANNLTVDGEAKIPTVTGETEFKQKATFDGLAAFKGGLWAYNSAGQNLGEFGPGKALSLLVSNPTGGNMTYANVDSYSGYIVVGKPSSGSAKTSVYIPRAMLVTGAVDEWQISDDTGYVKFTFHIISEGSTAVHFEVTGKSSDGSILKIYGVN